MGGPYRPDRPLGVFRFLLCSFTTSWHVSDVCGPQLSFRTAGFVACHFKWGIFVFSQVSGYGPGKFTAHVWVLGVTTGKCQCMTQTRGWGQLMHQNGSTKPYATSYPVIPGPSVCLLPFAGEESYFIKVRFHIGCTLVSQKTQLSHSSGW